MAAISKITSLAARQLQDVTGETWDDEDVLIPYINAGIAELINLKPEANPVTTTIDLIAGPVQSIGTDKKIVSLLDAVCNVVDTTTSADADTYGPLSSMYFDGTYVHAIEISTGNLMTFSIDDGGVLELLDTTTDGRAALGGAAKCIWGNGTFVVTVSGTSLYSYAMEDGELAYKGTINTGGTIYDIANYGSFIVVASGSTLKTYSLNSGGAFTLLDANYATNSALGLTVQGDFVYYILNGEARSLEYIGLNSDGTFNESLCGMVVSNVVNPIYSDGTYIYARDDINDGTIVLYTYSQDVSTGALTLAGTFTVTDEDDYNLCNGITGDGTYIYVQSLDSENAASIITLQVGTGGAISLVSTLSETIDSTAMVSMVCDGEHIYSGALAGYISTAGVLSEIDWTISTTTSALGKNVTTIDKKIIDNLISGWMTLTANSIVDMVVVDDRDPKTFYTVPPQPTSGQGQLRVIRSEMPDDVTATTNEFPLDDAYVPIMVDYVIYRALAEETTVPNALSKSQQFYQSFLSTLGYKKTVEKEFNAKGK